MVDLHLREVKVIEKDRNGMDHDTTDQLSIYKDPLIFSLKTQFGKVFASSTMGVIWIKEDELIDHIHIYRESWAEHLGLVGGLNAFWLMMVWCLCKCLTNN